MYSLVRRQAQTIVLVLGSCVVVLWTVLRHITNGINFDVVGQIGVVEQRAQGLHSAVQLGSTNYVLKFPLYYIVNQLHFLAPMDRLLLLALICNVLTFGFIFALLIKLAELYGVRQRRWLYLAIGWLATIAGKVFWVDYANSRNLETVGGLLVLYMILKYWREGRKITLVGATAIAVLTFFADPLQLYIIIGGLMVSLLVFLTKNYSMHTKALPLRRSTEVGIALMIAVAIAKILTGGSNLLLQISYLRAPIDHLNWRWSTVAPVLQSLGRNTLKIFDADVFKQPYSFNSLRNLLNVVILIAVVSIIIRLAVKRRLRPIGYIGLILMLVNYGLYIASGQVLHAETSRYLVMIPLILLAIFVIHADRLPKVVSKNVAWLWLTGLTASSLLLAGAVGISWPQRHSKDAPIYAAVSYMNQQHFTYALANREFGVTATYFSQGAKRVLPMGCTSEHRLQMTNLFYDSAGFEGLQNYHGIVPIIIEKEGIRFDNYTCTQSDIIAQFGTPKSVQPVLGIGSALIYDANQLKQFAVTGIALRATSAPSTENLTSLLPLQSCDDGTTDVFVAHPDDDILFMNPDLERQLLQQCVRTVYVTAADAGHGKIYWQGREQGIEAAYALMAGATNNWYSLPTMINGRKVVQRVLAEHPTLSLVFLRLPDGNVKGEGFPSTNHESLSRLAKHKIKIIHAVDGGSKYTNGALIQTLAAVIKVDQPSTIYSQLLSGKNSEQDHSDHRAVGRLATRAKIAANSDAQVSLYFGYSVNGLEPNLDTPTSLRKQEIFKVYAQGDTEICRTKSQCFFDETYVRYFSRSYKIDVKQPRPPKAKSSGQTSISPDKSVNELLFRGQY